jgi:diguanylate cyclase (GGDEF)-like protein
MAETEKRYETGKLHILALSAWALLVFASLGWGLYQEREQSHQMAKNTARANFDKDQAFRAWATSHGGVYVPVDEGRTPPNPYLAHIPERDITTENGKQYTLMNPAYMLRQMMDEYSGLYGSKGHITSLKTLNPHNKPDAWEVKALKSFEKGNKEAFEFTEINGAPFVRLMRPMVTTEGCLKCHAHQGYEVGNIRGGVSVSVPLDPFYDNEQKAVLAQTMTHIVFGILGVLELMYIFRKREEHLASLKEAHEHLEQMANFDALTELPNRNLFNDRLAHAVARTKRQGNRLALMFLDLDNFKTINDTMGHSIGDKLLVEVAERLLTKFRETDTIARLGGDEFVLVVDDVDDVAPLEVLAKKILELFVRSFKIEGHELYISPSVGISLYPDDADNERTLIQHADTAMYKAKALGKSTYQFYTREMNELVHERMQLEMNLRKALENDELYLVYQPQYSTRERTVVGFEALLRWKHPVLGEISPEQFIPVAEETGLIYEIGRWVMRQAFETNQKWYREGLSNVPVSVNVSAKQIHKLGFIECITEILNASELPPHMVKVEVTESMLMQHFNESIERLEQIRKMGATISLDDFGTGYSSLSYLKQFPVDEVKIDRSFVQDTPDDAEDVAIVKAVLAWLTHCSCGLWQKVLNKKISLNCWSRWAVRPFKVFCLADR